MLGLRVLGVKGLVWLWQMRNPINEVLDSIQDIVSTQLKRTNTPPCCTTEIKPWKEPPLNNSFLQGAGFASILSSVTSDNLAKSPAHLQSHLIDRASLKTFEAQTQRGLITGLPGDVSGLEPKRKVKRQLAAASAALGCQRSDWECKEREVKPAYRNLAGKDIEVFPRLTVNSLIALKLDGQKETVSGKQGIQRDSTLRAVYNTYMGWRLNHFPGQPVPMLDNPLGEEKFPNIQSKPPLAQLEAISSCPITCYLGEETDPHLSTTSFQAKQSQLPQPLLIRLLLQTLHQLRCPSLHTLQHLNIPLVVGGPKLNTVFEVRPHQCRVQGHNHFPSPAGHAIFDTSQGAIGFLGRLGTLLAHIQAAVNKHPQVPLCQAAFQPLFPKPVTLHGVVVAQVQDLALSLVKPHTIDLGPSIQSVQVPLQSLPTLQQINTPTQLGVICKLTESTLDPFVQIIDKDVKQNWPQHRALGNTACDRLPIGVNSIHHHSLGPAVQPVLYPAKRTPVQAMSSQFLQENAVGDRVKGFTEVQIDNIHSLSLIH
ncbi:hypothetical protein QYF61_009052 [Mycteria americana]|uniref:Uncharacterized protein n=1 Tax=Mycteria americana TaxID=33587 RepID=A0AAN7NNE3_MYCAM|nr:hypothetical protein QYF61_009052 [Mycteria americana]